MDERRLQEVLRKSSISVVEKKMWPAAFAPAPFTPPPFPSFPASPAPSGPALPARLAEYAFVYSLGVGALWCPPPPPPLPFLLGAGPLTPGSWGGLVSLKLGWRACPAKAEGRPP